MENYENVFDNVEEIDVAENIEEVEEDIEDVKDSKPTLFALVVNAESVYMREGPSKDYEPITILKKESIVEIIGEEDEWYHVANTSGIEGWMMKKFISII